MSSSRQDASREDPRLNEILAHYLQAAESGQPIDREQFIREHPEYEDELREFFADKGQLDEIAAGIALDNSPPEKNTPIDAPTVPPESVTRLDQPSTDLKATPQAPQPGTIIRYFGDYELLEEIARGGMGVVYKARQVKLNRVVALKMILTGQLASKEDVQRFYTEAEAAAGLDHPGIVPIFEVGEHEGQHYFSMGFVDGESLSAKLADKPLAPREAAELLQQVAESVQYAHDQGVIHRDLKPANILLDSDGQSKVTDFGLAKKTEGDSHLTGTGQILGTPSYMPPEQAAGRLNEVRESADVYSLGAILYATLTSRPPFQADNPLDTLMQVLERQPVQPRQLSPNVPRDLETICLKCLEKDRRRRYASARDLSAELKRFLDGEPILARPISQAARAWRWCRRKPVVASLSAVVLALLLFLGIVGPIVAFRQTRLATQNARLAKTESDARNEAEQKSKALEKQLRISNATRLAFQSQNVRDQFPTRSLLLAIEGVESTWRHDKTITPIAHDTLLNTVPLVGGRPLIGQSVAISANGRWLVTSSADAAARVWDLHAKDPGSSPLVLQGILEPVLIPNTSLVGRATAISGDGRWLAVASQQSTKVWDLRSDDPASPVHEFDGHKGRILGTAISSDGRWLVRVGADQSVRLWNLTAEDPTASSVVLQHKESASFFDLRVAISPNGRWLVTGGYITTRLWDLTAVDTDLSPIVLPCGSSFAFSSDSRWLAWDSGPTVRVCDLNAEDKTESSLALQGHREGVASVAMSADGRWLVADATYPRSQDAAVRLWDLHSKDPAATPLDFVKQGGPVISPNGKWLATVSLDEGSTLSLWNLSAKAPTTSPLVLGGHDGAAKPFAIAMDGRWLVTGGGDGMTRLWDLRSEDPSSEFALPGESPDVSPDSRWLVTKSRDRTVRLRNLGFEDSSSEFAVPGAQNGWISPDGRWLATWTRDEKIVRLWDLNGNNLRSAPLMLRHQFGLLRFGFSPNGRWWIMDCSDKTTRLWDLHAKDPVSSPNELPGHSIVRSSLNSRWLVTGSEDNKGHLWDLNADAPFSSSVVLPGPPIEKNVRSQQFVVISPDGRWLVIKNPRHHPTKLWDLTSKDTPPRELPSASIAFSPDGRWLAMGARDLKSPSNHVQLWNLRVNNPASSSIKLPETAHHPNSSPSFSPDSRWLLTSSLDNKARLWDLRVNNPASSSMTLPGVPVGPAQSFSSDGRWLVTAGSEKIPLLWNLSALTSRSSPLMLGGHDGPIRTAMLSPDGSWIVTAGDDKVILRPLDVDSLLKRARRQAGRDLTRDERKQYFLDISTLIETKPETAKSTFQPKEPLEPDDQGRPN